MSVIPLRPLHFDVNRVPLVVIDCKTLHLRRYVGRECTNEAALEGTEYCSGQDIREAIELFREAPRRAFAKSQAFPADPVNVA